MFTALIKRVNSRKIPTAIESTRKSTRLMIHESQNIACSLTCMKKDVQLVLMYCCARRDEDILMC